MKSYSLLLAFKSLMAFSPWVRSLKGQVGDFMRFLASEYVGLDVYIAMFSVLDSMMKRMWLKLPPGSTTDAVGEDSSGDDIRLNMHKVAWATCGDILSMALWGKDEESDCFGPADWDERLRGLYHQALQDERVSNDVAFAGWLGFLSEDKGGWWLPEVFPLPMGGLSMIPTPFTFVMWVKSAHSVGRRQANLWLRLVSGV